MKKESVVSYLIRFTVCNLLALLIYECACRVLNLVTGGAIAMYTGMLESSGYTPDDLSPTMKILVPVLLIVLAISVFFVFYLLMLLSVKRNKKLRGEFIRSIGGEAFDRNAFTKTFLKSGQGKQELICFAALTLVSAISMYFYIPVLSFVFQPQTVLAYYTLVLLISLSGPLTSPLIPALYVIIINMVSYFLYLKIIIPRVYEKWASERRRSETTEKNENQ